MTADMPTAESPRPSRGTTDGWPSAIGLLSACVAALILYGVHKTPFGVDDAWITYRYAENLAAGQGFVYNAGEHVLGTSTPLYTLALAAAALLGLDVPAVSATIGLAGMVAGLVLLFVIVRDLHGPASGVAAAWLLGSAYLYHRVATYGMETPFYVVLILATFLAYIRGRTLLAAGIAALCILTRLDGVAVGAALFVVHVARYRRLPWREALVYLAIAAPWFAFSNAYFDSLVPNSVAAKRMHTDYTLLWWMPQWLLTEPRAYAAVIGAAVVLARPAQRVLAAPLVLWGVLYAAAYSAGAIHRYDWYQTPLLAVLAGGAGIGVVALAERMRHAKRTALLVASVVAVAGAPDAYVAVRRLAGDEGVLGIERIRYEAAIWMRDNLPDDAPIATGGIGLVGYYTGRHIYDAMGLVTPGSMRVDYDVADPRNVPFPRFLPAVIADYAPEYVFDGFWLPDGADVPQFMLGTYEVTRIWTASDPRWPTFILYRRN